MDKRVLRTRESIKTAFMQLMLESELEKITVCDITERAKINRSTFYLHYNDVTGVIADIDKEFAENIAACIDDFDILDVYGSIYNIFSSLSNQLDRDEVRKKYIIYSSDMSEVTAKLKRVFADKTMDAILKHYPSLEPEEIIYPVTFASAGIIESYIKWCRAQDSRKPLDGVIRDVSSITDYILSNIANKINPQESA